MNKILNKKYLIAACACLLVMLAVVYFYFFAALSAKSDTVYVLVDQDDTIDSVLVKVAAEADQRQMSGLKTLIRHSSYSEHIRTGRYAIRPGEGAYVVFRHLKNGQQTPLRLTLPSVRTLDRLAAELGTRLMADSAEWQRSFTDTALCQRLGVDTATLACLLIPNTYDIYWNTTPEKFLERMKTESDRFWEGDRDAKAARLRLTRQQVITLASIIDEETANNAEKPMVAGMYYNRLMLRNAEYPDGMPLQADPTIKYAWRRFDLKRIYHNLLSIDSPYNTYKNTGLPPGPIRIASVAGIDAVLDLKHHNYLYMCAKEDFSGTHNFATTYQEHQVNARRYSEALNKRGIK